MIGNLTVDKASMNISYFLNTVRIIDANGGRISRSDFVQQMADFIGVPARKDGKENRTPYNKSKLPRYFGFVDIDTDADGTNYLVLTNRGRKLVGFIYDKADHEPAQRYSINPENREEFIDLIFESVIFDSFGKNNCGAEQSNTDVEPPKIVFKTLQELGRATVEEICYVIFGLNKGLFGTFEEALSAVRQNRENYQYDYSSVMEEWQLSNIVNDFKIINIFTDNNIQLIRSDRDEDYDKVFYYLSSGLSQRHLDQIKTINAIYQPLRLFVYTDGNDLTIQDWVNDAVLGGVSDNSFVFQYNVGDKMCGSNNAGVFTPGIFEKALLKAFQHPKKNVFLILNHITESEISAILDKYYPLLDRVNALSDPMHGWSLSSIEDAAVYGYLESNMRSISKTLTRNKIKIPSNIQLVGTIIMENTTGNENFSYEFTRALVRTSAGRERQENYDDVERLSGGTNTLLYGVPGSGKSWTIEHEYCHPGSAVERLVFHPDYTNADFIGQILPVVDADKQVTYEFTPGPFTTILKDAYTHPMREYILIIEEINRGNAPSIFGEVFQLLDRVVEPKSENGITYPVGTSEYGVTHKYMAEHIYGDPTHKVRIPSNLFIVGTMNTSDQNVFTLDTAFQRRWRMRLIENNFNNVRASLADAKILDTDVTWKTFCDTINKIIVGNRAKMASAEDKRLGVYFVHENDIIFDDRALPTDGHLTLLAEYDSLLKDELANNMTPEKKQRLTEIREAVMHNRLFPEKVIKYLWDDAFKFNPEALFDTVNMESLEQVIRTFIYSKGRERFKIFKSTVRSSLYSDVQE